MRRRTFLRTAAGATLLPALPGVAGATADSRQDPGIVWSRRDRNPGTGRLFDVVHGPGGGFVFAGYGTASGSDRTYVQVTDRWGRERVHRRGSDENEWGDRGYELVAGGDGFLLAGVEDDTPTLVGFALPPHPTWARTYDGTPAGAVRAATTGDGHAVGWTEADGSVGVTVVGTDGDGTERWSDRPGADGAGKRRLAALVSPGDGSASVVAVGTRDGGSSRGWATVWGPDGNRVRDLRLDVPGDGPGAAAVDGEAVLLAGTTGDGWWLQRRQGDWTTAWTRTYTGDGGGEGDDRTIEDLAVRTDGYGLLATDADGTVLVRTDSDGEERWRGRYAPYTDDGPADRGHAIVPVDGDGFLLAGTTAPGEEGRDWWWARVGEPGETTPETPEPTPTPGPTTTPPPGDPTEPVTTTSPAETTATTSGTPTADTDGTPSASPAGSPGGTPNSSAGGPGFGIPAAVTGLAAWLAARRGGD